MTHRPSPWLMLGLLAVFDGCSLLLYCWRCLEMVHTCIDSEDEGMEMLLGGLPVSSFTDATCTWRDEESISSNLPPASDAERMHGNEKPGTNPRHTSLVDISKIIEEEESHGCYDRAFYCSPNGQLLRPPVCIVDMSSVNNRGNGLVATRLIREGQVIYTEQAALATQLPKCTICHGRTKGPWQSDFRVRACQSCFRSLEPISTLSSEMPSPGLWPIPEFHENRNETNDQYRIDTHGRLQCTSCQAIFCSKSCCDGHYEKMGSCCNCSTAIEAVARALHPKNDNDPECSDSNVDECMEVQPAVILAARMFVFLLQRYRSSVKVDLGLFDGICGSANDISALEVGLPEEVDKDTCSYTLSPPYEAIYHSLGMSNEEKEHFTLECFQRLAAIAARNGFAIKTQSPFHTYYAALLRAAGGRGTSRHSELMKQVAVALGSKNGTLQRDMDRKVEELCAVQVVGLFSLTARINHSCDPCAEVRSQEFVDCYIDLVAKRDILAGEEITISYINVGRTAGRGARDRMRRLRELRSRYLFECDCVKCCSNGICSQSEVCIASN